MPAPKHSTRKVLVEMTQYEYQLMKDWLILAYHEYFDGNEPDGTGFSNSEAHHLGELISKIRRDHRAWSKYFLPPVKPRKPRF